jgi:hypothetical protein
MIRKNRTNMYRLFLTKKKLSYVFYAEILFFICYISGLCFAGNTKNIMLTGYWPPTNEMLRKFSTDPNHNPGSWAGGNWEDRGYDIYAYFPEFPGGTGSNKKGNGDLEVDYQDVGSWSPPAAPTGDFWRITSEVHPVAIMSYGMDSGASGTFEMEYNARNISSWTNDYQAPKQPTPAPPDTGKSTGYVRNSSLPIDTIAEAINSSGLGIKVWVDWTGNPGGFLCEYMAYHDGWYQNLHSDPCDQYRCLAAGFTHVAGDVNASTATTGVEAALRALISYLNSQLPQYTVSGTITLDDSPLAGVTMCGLPGNPDTNSSGVYTAQVGGGWSGVVTPLKSGYAFTQKTYSNVIANQSAQDYTASAATADTIVFDACSSNSSGSASSTLSWSHTIGSGDNRTLIVSAVCEDSTPADQIMSSVRFNGINMTAVPGSIRSRSNSSSSILRTELYYMLNPPAGTYTVLITYNGSVSYRVGGAISLRNVKQQIPEAVIANSATSASISTNIDVPNTGAWIVDVVGHSNSGTFTSSTSTERWDRNSGNHTGAGATKAVVSAGSNTMSWTFSGSSGAIVHSLAAFAPSETVLTLPGQATSPNPSTGATNVSITQDIGWTAGSGATSHIVYFGTSSPGTLQGEQAGTTFDTGTMSNNTTYYWRIDEKNAGGITTGTVWSFATKASVPNVLNMTQAAATTAINNAGLVVGNVTQQCSNSVAAGSVISQSPVGETQVDIGSSVDLVVSSGPCLRTISGYVTEPDANILAEGVFIEANNDGGSDTTDVNGYYELTVAYGWSGSVALSKTGYTFEPNGINYNNVTTDLNDNYIATLDTFLISGYAIGSVTHLPLAGVLVAPDGNGGPFTSKYHGGGSDITDVNGYYEVLVDYNWSGSVVPSKYAYAFEPNSLSYAGVTQDRQADQNYVGTLLMYKITGYIKNACQVPIEGVLAEANNGGGSDTTDANGYYEVWVSYNWSGTVTASNKSHYTFDPVNRAYTDVFENKTDQDYLADNIYDLDCNDPIGFGDVAIISENWLSNNVDIHNGDFNGDGIVNFLDFSDFADVWQED